MILYFQNDPDYGVAIVAKQLTLPGIEVGDAYINIGGEDESSQE